MELYQVLPEDGSSEGGQRFSCSAPFNRLHELPSLASVLLDEFKPLSNIDVLVEFEVGHVPGLAFFTMEAELTEIFGHKVELHTPRFLSRYFREKVMAEAEVQYVTS